MNEDFARFRPCVGCMLVNADNSIFVGRRKDIKNPAMGWQMPQGGVGEGEDLRSALLRELQEEIGTDKVTVVDCYDKWLFYRFPEKTDGANEGNYYKTYLGQRQKWFLCRFEGSDSDVDLHTESYPEFVEWKWANPEFVLNNIVDFKKQIYEEIIRYFMAIIGGVDDVVE